MSNYKQITYHNPIMEIDKAYKKDNIYEQISGTFFKVSKEKISMSSVLTSIRKGNLYIKEDK